MNEVLLHYEDTIKRMKSLVHTEKLRSHLESGGCNTLVATLGCNKIYDTSKKLE